MVSQEAVFEAPAAHEAIHYSSPEMELESPEAGHYSTPEAHYSSPEAHYSNPEEEAELGNILGAIGGALGFEAEDYSSPEAHYSSPEWEEEEELGNILGSIGSALGFESEDYSSPEAHYSSPELEWEDEADPFFGKALRRIGRGLGGLAKRFAPSIVRSLVGMIPGVGAIAGPLAGQLTSSLLREGEAMAMELEAEFFSSPEFEVGATEQAHEAALTELLAAEASMASTEAEAESVIAATLPLTITIMGGRRALRPVVPIMTQANARLTRSLRRRGPAGRQLLRTIPTIQRTAVATMRAANQAGRPVTGPLAVRAMAAATQRVLGNPRRVQRAVERNIVLRRRVAPPSPRRAAVFVPGRVAPFHPRRAAGWQPMRATPRPRARQRSY
jgi:hypothetical protein